MPLLPDTDMVYNDVCRWHAANSYMYKFLYLYLAITQARMTQTAQAVMSTPVMSSDDQSSPLNDTINNLIIQSM